MMESPFLDEATVRHIHRDQLKRYGGRDGVRDENSLKSAIAMPRASFGGQFLHHNPFGIAAAYAFHLAENQPFIDGNKRTALAAALTFLEVCGISLKDPESRLFDAMIELGHHRFSKADLEQLFASLAQGHRP